MGKRSTSPSLTTMPLLRALRSELLRSETSRDQLFSSERKYGTNLPPNKVIVAEYKGYCGIGHIICERGSRKLIVAVF